MLANGHSVGRVGISGTAGTVDPSEDSELFDIALGNRGGDGLQIGCAPDLDRAATARTSGVRSRSGGDPPDAGLKQHCERAAFLGDPDGAASVPDMFDCEGGHPRAILRLIADSHSQGSTVWQDRGLDRRLPAVVIAKSGRRQRLKELETAGILYRKRSPADRSR
jgi:hypothetical protein